MTGVGSNQLEPCKKEDILKTGERKKISAFGLDLNPGRHSGYAKLKPVSQAIVLLLDQEKVGPCDAIFKAGLTVFGGAVDEDSACAEWMAREFVQNVNHEVADELCVFAVDMATDLILPIEAISVTGDEVLLLTQTDLPLTSAVAMFAAGIA